MKLSFIYMMLIIIISSCSIKTNDEQMVESLKNKIKKEIAKETDSDDFAKNFLAKLEEWHPGEQNNIYHSFLHTLLVGDLMLKVIKKDKSLTKKERKLLLMAALLHDLEPDRIPNSAPKVEATINFFNDPKTSFIFDKVVNKKKIAALIKYTDFSLKKEEQNKIWDKADELVRENFNNKTWANTWGMRLAVVDKLAMYVIDWDFAVEAVKKLALETKSDEDYMLKNTYYFLEPLASKLDDLNLDHDIRDNFISILDEFKNLSKK